MGTAAERSRETPRRTVTIWDPACPRTDVIDDSRYLIGLTEHCESAGPAGTALPGTRRPPGTRSPRERGAPAPQRRTTSHARARVPRADHCAFLIDTQAITAHSAHDPQLESTRLSLRIFSPRRMEDHEGMAGAVESACRLRGNKPVVRWETMDQRESSIGSVITWRSKVESRESSLRGGRWSLKRSGFRPNGATRLEPGAPPRVLRPRIFLAL